MIYNYKVNIDGKDFSFNFNPPLPLGTEITCQINSEKTFTILNTLIDPSESLIGIWQTEKQKLVKILRPKDKDGWVGIEIGTISIKEYYWNTNGDAIDHNLGDLVKRLDITETYRSGKK